MGTIITGLILTGVGALMVIKTDSFQGMTGRIAWAEQKIGPGGTSTFIKLLGVGVIFIGFMLIFGLHERFLLTILGPIFGQ